MNNGGGDDNINRGSQWRKWDLHVHTPASYYHEFKVLNDDERRNYNGDIWEKYIDELEEIQDVAVIGITDYFSIEGYKKILGYRKKGRLQNFDLILPNIEFRANIITSQNNRLNFHVIFSDGVDINDIEDFLKRGILMLSEPGSGHFQRVSCTRWGLIKVGRAYANDETLPEEKALKIGFKQAVVDINQLLNELESTPGFKGKYLIIIGEDAHGGLSEIPYDQSGHLRTELYRKCHIIESSNQNTINFWLGKSEKITVEELKSRFGGCKPCIKGSDAHAFNKLCKPTNGFTWIKADPTFEGLKQIIYEPEGRVRIQEDCPEPTKRIYTLSSIKISNSKMKELEIEEQEIPFNSNLVAVIGGKGSGKTALLDLIANCFEDRCERDGNKKEDKNSFVQRVEKEKPDLTVEISFIGDVENFSKELTEEKFFQNSKITYLPQGKIEEYSENRKKLHEKIKEIIFNNKEVIESEYKQKYDELSEEIKKLENNIENLNSEIYKLERDTDYEIVKDFESEKNIKIGDLKDKEDKFQYIIKKRGEYCKDEVNKLRDDENKLGRKYSKLETIKKDLLELQKEIKNLNANSKINKLNSNLKELDMDENIPLINTNECLSKINEIRKIIESKMADVSNQRDDIDKQLNELLGIEREHDNLLDEIKNIKNEIESLENKIKEIDKKKEYIEKLKEERKEKYVEFIRRYIELKDMYEEIIKVFSNGKDEILNNINFKSNIYFDKSKFLEKGIDIFDRRRVPQEQISKTLENLYDIISSDTAELQSKIEEYITEAFNFREYLKKTRTNLDFYNWVFENYFSLSTEIFFDGTPMDKLSIGQKGTVLLKIFLAEGDHPLIIDQPEDNLDNKFIYDTLVGAFREAKKKRQVIISTHNANLVVNTDAEQVIVAEFKNNRISYRCGSIENEEIRKDITKLLEGGDEAFKKREEKYGIKTASIRT